MKKLALSLREKLESTHSDVQWVMPSKKNILNCPTWELETPAILDGIAEAHDHYIKTRRTRSTWGNADYRTQDAAESAEGADRGDQKGYIQAITSSFNFFFLEMLAFFHIVAA